MKTYSPGRQEGGVVSDKPSKAKQIAEKFADQVRERQLPEPEREYVFASDLGRRWRFDFAWPDQRIALEIEGLVVRKIAGQLVCQGRHATVSGFVGDCEKYAWAVALGWRVLRFAQAQVKSRFAIDMLVRVLAGTIPTNQTACAAKPDKRRGAGVSGSLDFGAPF